MIYTPFSWILDTKQTTFLHIPLRNKQMVDSSKMGYQTFKCNYISKVLSIKNVWFHPIIVFVPVLGPTSTSTVPSGWARKPSTWTTWSLWTWTRFSWTAWRRSYLPSPSLTRSLGLSPWSWLRTSTRAPRCGTGRVATGTPSNSPLPTLSRHPSQGKTHWQSVRKIMSQVRSLGNRPISDF